MATFGERSVEVRKKVGAFGDVAVTTSLSPKFWSGVTMGMFLVTGIFLLALPKLLPDALRPDLLRAHRPIEVALGLVLAVGGLLGLLYVNRPQTGSLGAFWVKLAGPTAALGGLVLATWPDTDSFLPAHQQMFGIVLAGTGLAVSVFAYGWREPDDDGETPLHATLAAHRLELGSILLISGFAVGLALVWEYDGPTAPVDSRSLLPVGMMGVIVLVTTLLACNIFSGDPGISTSEVRTAVTLSVLSMFCVVLGLGDRVSLAPDGILGVTLENFWKVLIAVIGFHFGGQALEGAAGRIAEATANRKAGQEGKAKEAGTKQQGGPQAEA